MSPDFKIPASRTRKKPPTAAPPPADPRSQLKPWMRKILDGKRLTDREAISLFGEDLATLARYATIVRDRLHDHHATFIVDLNLNLTNVCSCDCGFCAFKRLPGAKDAFVLDTASVLARIRALDEIGGTQVLMQGGINDALGLDYYTGLLQAIRQEFPKLTIHSFSPPEIAGLAKQHGLGVRDVLETLRTAGLDSLPGGGAEILVESVRHKMSPKKIKAAEWLAVMRTAQELGMPTTATMMFGALETQADRIGHLSAIRQLQDETQGFRAFIPWTFSPEKTKFAGVIKAGGAEYLKTLAICRLYLDNIPNLGSGWLTEGMPVAQLGLLCGANDMGGILMEEKVIESTGLSHRTNIEDLITAIRGAGYSPARRDSAYRILEEF
jgi:cyclic dehypoxanthinyl futalosine synthase